MYSRLFGPSVPPPRFLGLPGGVAGRGPEDAVQASKRLVLAASEQLTNRQLMAQTIPRAARNWPPSQNN